MLCVVSITSGNFIFCCNGQGLFLSQLGNVNFIRMLKVHASDFQNASKGSKVPYWKMLQKGRVLPWKHILQLPLFLMSKELS